MVKFQVVSYKFGQSDILYIVPKMRVLTWLILETYCVPEKNPVLFLPEYLMSSVSLVYPCSRQKVERCVVLTHMEHTHSQKRPLQLNDPVERTQKL